MTVDVLSYVSRVERRVDRYELEEAIRDAFAAELGDGIVNIRVSEFPHEYGVLVFLSRSVPERVESLVDRLEEAFRAQDIPVGILVRAASPG